MTDQQRPDPGPTDETRAWSSDTDVSTPAATDPTSAQPATIETGTFGQEATPRRRGTGMRWIVALAGVAAVAIATTAFLLLTSGRPATSPAAGYMPPGTISYAEYRLDFPGDQRQKLAAFLAHFPGFDDQAALDTKVREALDQISGAATDNEHLYSRDIEPWFGGTIATGAGPIPSAEAFDDMSQFGNQLAVVTVKDRAKAVDWLRRVLPDTAVESEHAGAVLFTMESDFGSPAAVAVNDEVLIGGSESSVRAAVDSGGDGDLAADPEFQAAFQAINRDYVMFAWSEPRAMAQQYVDLLGGSAADETTIDDELLPLLPAWTSTAAWLEDDAIASRTSYPSVDLGFEASNHASTLAGFAPANTVLFAETHDVGAALTAFIDRLRDLPELENAFREIDQVVGMVGGIDGLIGWWGDAAVAVSELEDGSIGGGLLIAPTDAEDADGTLQTLRSLIGLAGGSIGIEIREVEHDGVTITVLDLSGAAGAVGQELPSDVPAEIAYASTDGLVVIGLGEAWVTAVLDAGDGPSLAEDDRYEALLERVGAENTGSWFIDVEALRELIEPIAESEAPADQWARYIADIQPYVLPFDAVVAAITKEGDIDRADQVLTVK